MTSRKQRPLISLVSLGLLILLSFNQAIYNSQNFDGNTLKYGENPISSEIGSLNMRNSPFFNHSESDSSLYSQLSRELFPDFSIFMRSLNISGGIHVEDDKFYSGDQFLYLLGSGQIHFEDHSVLNDNYIDIKNSIFWDEIEGGFYNQIDSDFQLLNEKKLVYDNLLALKFLEESQDSNLQTEIPLIWDALLDNFWNESRGAYDHSDNDVPEFLAADNFLASTILFESTRNLGGIIGAELQNYGATIMNLFNSSMFDTNNPSFYSFLDLVDDNHNLTTDKHLMTNALGISALLGWNTVTDFNSIDPKSSPKVEQAISIWNFLNDTFYNDVYDMYMSSSNEDGSLMVDQQVYLNENTWMLMATLELFKITGNLTYYSSALKHFYGIENSLYDESNKGYIQSTRVEEQNLILFDSYNLLLSSLNSFYEIYESTIINIDVNQSRYLYIIDPQFNVSINFNISMQFNFSSTIGIQWEINVPISNASTEYTLRYRNDTIIDEKLDSSTDLDGNDEYLFNYPMGSPIDIYELTILCNKTGFKQAYGYAEIQKVSGITIDSFIFESSTDIIHQGETKLLNMTFISEREDNLSVLIKNSGENFEDLISEQIVLINSTETTALINITAKETALTGYQDLSIEIYNNSVLLTDKIFRIFIQSSVIIEFFSFERLIDFQPFQISIPITNVSTAFSEPLQVSMSSPYFEEINKTIDSIPYMKTIEESLILIPNNEAYYGFLEITINFSRYGLTYYSENFYIESVPEVEIIGLEYSENIIQGQSPLISINILNYNLSAQSIIIKSNDVNVSEVSAEYGLSEWNIAIDSPKNNPYDVSQKSYYIEILDDNGKILSTKVVIVNIQPSVINVVMFYILPILIPIGIMLYFKHKELEFDIRNK